MKDIYKNTVLYYILIPVLIAFWPIMIKAVYLPKLVELKQKEQAEFESAQKVADQIIQLDPSRLNVANRENVEVDFDYATVFNKIASQYSIRPNQYSVSEKPAQLSRGKKNQDARVELEGIDLKTFSQFLSTLLQNWSDLECQDIELIQNKGLKDSWNISLRFKYTSSV